MTVGVRRLFSSIVVLVVAAVLVPGALAGSRDDVRPAKPTLYVQYTMNCTFSIVDDFGKRVSSIPPGDYQIEVSTPMMFKLVRPGGVGVDYIDPNDFTGCKGWVQFQLTGPGVDLSTTLDFGCDAFLVLSSETFKAGASYVFQDLNQPAVTRTTLSVLSSGSPQIPQSPYVRTSNKSTTSTDQVGSQIAPFRGTLTGIVNAGGKPVLLAKNGKVVSTLKSGRYKFAIDDKSTKRGFMLQKASNKRPNVVTGVTFVGKKTKPITLKAGEWTYFSAQGKSFFFIVTR